MIETCAPPSRAFGPVVQLEQCVLPSHRTSCLICCENCGDVPNNTCECMLWHLLRCCAPLSLTMPTPRASHVPKLPPHPAWCRLHANICDDVPNATCETLWCHLLRSFAPVSPTRPTPRKFEAVVANQVLPFPPKRPCCPSSRDHERTATCWCMH